MEVSRDKEARLSLTRTEVRNAIHRNIGLRMALAIVNPESYQRNLDDLADALADSIMKGDGK